MSSVLNCVLTLTRADEAFTETIKVWGFQSTDDGLIWRGQVAGPDRLRFLGLMSRYAALMKGIQLQESSGNPSSMEQVHAHIA
jgi:ABC-2 type transport system ATP-binding protein